MCCFMYMYVHVECVGRCTYTYVYSSMRRLKDSLCFCSSGAAQLFIDADSPMNREHIKYTRL